MPKGILTIIFLSLLIFDFVFFLYPKYQEFSNLSSQKKTSEFLVRSREGRISQLKQIYQEILTQKDLIERVDSALPSKFQTAQLLYFLAKSAQDNGLILQEVNFTFPSFSDENQKLKEIFLALKLSGSYPAFKNFLFALENSARLIETENISFAFSEKGIFNFNLKIKVYSY